MTTSESRIVTAHGIFNMISSSRQLKDKGTMYTWIKAFKEGRLSANEAVHTPKNALSLNDELIELRKRVKEQDKEIRRLKEENEFLEEASAFFAASRRKSAKNRD